MKRLLVISILALVVPATALAKGASEATIVGPGFSGKVVIPGDGEPGGTTTLGRIAELGGFFPSVFGQSPDPMLRTKPNVRLGPRYVVRYVMPGPGATSVIEQHIYPYATPYPVTYTKPGQLFWDGQRTYGGWYGTTVELKLALEEIGLPATAPSGGGDGGFWSSTPRVVGVFGGIGAAALAVVGFFLLIRRHRLQPAAAG